MKHDLCDEHLDAIIRAIVNRQRFYDDARATVVLTAIIEEIREECNIIERILGAPPRPPFAPT